jgi:hypothetical protein
MNDLIERYRRQHPASELNDVQIGCIRPLLAVHALHNWRHNLQGFTRSDGGFRACGPDGIVVLMKHGRLSTFDDAGLTRLVLAAFEHHCRVDIGTCRVDIGTGGFNTLRIQVNQRTEAGSLYSRHPGLDELGQMIDKRLTSPKD